MMARQGAASMFATALLLGVFANISPSDDPLSLSLTFFFSVLCLSQHCLQAIFVAASSE